MRTKEAQKRYMKAYRIRPYVILREKEKLAKKRKETAERRKKLGHKQIGGRDETGDK
jgi:hypothetical protein